MNSEQSMHEITQIPMAYTCIYNACIRGIWVTSRNASVNLHFFHCHFFEYNFWQISVCCLYCPPLLIKILFLIINNPATKTKTYLKLDGSPEPVSLNWLLMQLCVEVQVWFLTMILEIMSLSTFISAVILNIDLHKHKTITHRFIKYKLITVIQISFW